MTVGRGPGGLDGVGAIRSVADGATTVSDLRNDVLRRIAEWEPAMGAVTDVIDRPSRSGSLSGLMVAVKDQIDVAGYPHPVGVIGPGRGVPATRDAPIVAALDAAGSMIVARTSSPPPGVPGGVTPRTRNPRSPDRISGGSSGGSAAAVAAGLVHAALGTDSGGSIRIPAACCGVVGLNATRGAVPMEWTGGLTYSMGSAGPIAATVGDLRIVLERMLLAGAGGPHGGEPDRSAPQTRLGIPTELLAGPIDPAVRRVFGEVVALLEDHGHPVVDVEVAVGDAMEIGPRIIGVVEYVASVEDAFPEALEAHGMQRLVDAAAATPGTSVARAYHRRAALAERVRAVFDRVDVLILPTLPCRVPSANVDQTEEAEIRVGGVAETRTSALTRLVNPWNLAGLPTGTLPVARDPDGAPISVQFVGPPFADRMVVDLMEWLERASGGPWDTVDALTRP